MELYADQAIPKRAVPPPMEPATLTPAQHEVIALVALGLTNAEIAQQLGKKPGTVKRQVAESLRRMGARSRADAAVRFVRAQELTRQVRQRRSPKPP
ncbi:MAG: helix-turn-helix domain-containing protein [Candidatus Dormibacteria bacterium]